MRSYRKGGLVFDQLQNATGKIKATPPGTAPGGGDNSLPDPTHKATLWLAIFIGLAAALAVLLNAFKWTTAPFSPAATATASFALFAGFYVAAQVIERLMQLISPFVPWWPPPSTATDDAVKAAQTKADRGTVSLGIAAVLGVGASCGFGVFFLAAIGMHVRPTIDSFLTGVVIAAGTKPLHDFVNLLQSPTTPKTGSTSS
jgi:hypothetical protein